MTTDPRAGWQRRWDEIGVSAASGVPDQARGAVIDAAALLERLLYCLGHNVSLLGGPTKAVKHAAQKAAVQLPDGVAKALRLRNESSHGGARKRFDTYLRAFQVIESAFWVVYSPSAGPPPSDEEYRELREGGWREYRRKQYDEFRAKHPVGSVVAGIVTSPAEFGLFVAVARGVEGLLHVSELGRRDLSHHTEYASTGDEIRVEILEYFAETQKMRLGHRSILNREFKERYQNLGGANKTISARIVTRLTDGFVVQLPDELTGWVPHEDYRINDKRLPQPLELTLSIGKQYPFVTKGADYDRYRVILSVRTALVHRLESVVSATVRFASTTRLIVETPSGLIGVVESRDFSWTRNKLNYRPGDVVTVKVLNKEASVIEFGIKQLTPPPQSPGAAHTSEGHAPDSTRSSPSAANRHKETSEEAHQQQQQREAASPWAGLGVLFSCSFTIAAGLVIGLLAILFLSVYGYWPDEVNAPKPPTATPSPPPQPRQPTKDDRGLERVARFVKSWKNAWERSCADMDAYMDHYAEDFCGIHGKSKSCKNKAELRRQKSGVCGLAPKQTIRIALSEIETSLNGKKAEVVGCQHYVRKPSTGEQHVDWSRKTLNISLTKDGPKIVREVAVDARPKCL